MGKISRDQSKIGKVSLKEMGNVYISVCTKLGANFVDNKCRERGDVPCWTLSQIDQNMKDHMERNTRLNTFMVVKDGYQFWFQRF